MGGSKMIQQVRSRHRVVLGRLRTIFALRAWWFCLFVDCESFSNSRLSLSSTRGRGSFRDDLRAIFGVDFNHFVKR